MSDICINEIETAIFSLQGLLESMLILHDQDIPTYDDDIEDHKKFKEVLTQQVCTVDNDNLSVVCEWFECISLSILENAINPKHNDSNIHEVVSCIIMLLRTTPVINTDVNINSIFIIAAKKGYIDAVKYLLDEQNGEKANIHVWNDYALRLAAEGGHLNVVRYLLDEQNGEQADIHADNDGALRWAALNGHVSVVKYLLDERNGDDKANIHASNDFALRWAAKYGHLSVVRYLLDERNGDDKANIHTWDDTALRWSAEKGHLDVVRYLLDERNGEKADIYANHDYGLLYATKNVKSYLQKYLQREKKRTFINV